MSGSKEIISEYNNIKSTIKYHDKKYYVDSEPEITDADYDILRAKLIDLEKKYPYLISNDSPTNKVGFEVQKGFNKVKHSQPMLSLSNGFSFDDISEFIDRAQNFLNINHFPELSIEPKIDGVSFAARYENGELTKAITRGNGIEGEDITLNIKAIKKIPNHCDHKESFEVRGEIFMHQKDFFALNELQEKKSQKLFANPRNAASGSIRQLDTSITAARKLDYFIYAVINDNFALTQSDALEKIKKIGFSTNPNNIIIDNLDDLINYYNKLLNDRYNLSYDIDGIVYKINSYEYQVRLGEVARSPRYAIAHKFPALQATTKINNIIIQVGRTGALTPVACLEPVNIGGVIVARASLHNEDEIKRKDIMIGDIVTIERAGDVIPKVNNVLKDKRGEVNNFIFPSLCPVCGSKIKKETDEAVTRCIAEYSCSAQILGKLQNFVSRNAFNIDGINERQIEFLFNKNLVKDFYDFFTLEERQSITAIKLENFNGWGKKSVTNLYKSINNATNISLERFIYALSIRFVGLSNAKILARNYENIDNLILEMQQANNLESEEYFKLNNIDGIGEKLSQAVINYFNRKENIELINNLRKKVTIEPFILNINNSALNNKIVVFTGKLINYSRLEAKNLAERNGAKVSGSISKNTNYLIKGEGSGAKIKKAQELDIEVISEEDFSKLCN